MLAQAEVLVTWQSEWGDERSEVIVSNCLDNGEKLHTYAAIQMHKAIIEQYKADEEVWSFSTLLCLTYDSGRELIINEGDGS